MLPATSPPMLQPQPTAVEPPLESPRVGLDILLVEDDAADASLILGALEKHPSVLVAHAVASPLLALYELLAGRLQPDLVLLDLHMPRLSGFEFLKGLRRIPSLNKVPVVFLTTSDLGKDVFEYMHSSASLYVVKPDTFAELRTRMNGIIERAVSGVWDA